MKKLINAPETVVDEALAGMAAAHADLIRVEVPNIVVRRDAARPGKVGVISGGAPGLSRCTQLAGRMSTPPAGPCSRRPCDQMLAHEPSTEGQASCLVKNFTLASRTERCPGGASREEQVARSSSPTTSP
jgi:dihydroxyacetone kinase-like protein